MRAALEEILPVTFHEILVTSLLVYIYRDRIMLASFHPRINWVVESPLYQTTNQNFEHCSSWLQLLLDDFCIIFVVFDILFDLTFLQNSLLSSIGSHRQEQILGDQKTCGCTNTVPSWVEILEDSCL